MKHDFPANKSDHWKLPNGVLCLAIVALAAGAGCGKPKNTETPIPPPASDSAADPKASSAPANRMQPAPPPVTVSYESSPNGATQLQSLNRALLGWKMKNHRRPQNFEEFASTAGFQIPAPPAGKKYTLNSKGFIELVNSN